MEEVKHTAGRWVCEPYGTWSFAVRVPEAHIATVGNLGASSDHAPAAKRWKVETEANARLIASAPCLFKALRGLLAIVGDMHNEDFDEIKAAEAAIARATGSDQ